MTFSRGDIVIAFFPNASGGGSKPRPVLIVQSDNYNAKMKNTVVAAVTTNLKHASDPASVLIEVSSPDGHAFELIQDSVVSCVNLATIDEALIARKIGKLPDALMQRVDASLKVALGLP